MCLVLAVVDRVLVAFLGLLAFPILTIKQIFCFDNKQAGITTGIFFVVEFGMALAWAAAFG